MTDFATSHKEHLNLVPAATLVASFARHLRAENKRPKTIEHYVSATRQFLAFAEAEGMPAIQAISREHIEMWIESLYEGYAEASVLNRYLGLRAFFDWLVAEHEIEANPFGPARERRIKPPRVDEKRKDIVSPEDMARVIKGLEKDRRWRDLVIIALLYDCGLRASELADLRTENVDLDTGLILIDSRTKGRRPKVVRLSPKGIKWLDRYWRRPDRKAPEYAVTTTHGKLRRERIYHIVRRTFERAGIPGIGSHDLRHTSATHAAPHMSERDLMVLYGWKDPAMARHYARQALQDAALKAHETGSPLSRLED